MKRLDMNIAAARLLVTVCICTSGCQSAGDWLAKRFGSSDDKSKIVRNQQTPQLPPPEEITPEKRARVQLTMARAYERQGNVERALALYKEAIKSAPKSAEAHHRLAVLHDKQGQVDQSHDHYRQALKLKPNGSEIHCDYGYSCYLQGRMDEAERHLRHALSIDPRLARAHNNLGIILARKGNVQQALAEFHQAGCNEGEARVNLALGHLAEGRLDAAHHQLATASKLPTLSDETRTKMVRMQSLVARVDRREAAPLPPSTVTASGNPPASSGTPVSRVPVVGQASGVQFVSAAEFPQQQ